MAVAIKSPYTHIADERAAHGTTEVEATTVFRDMQLILDTTGVVG